MLMDICEPDGLECWDEKQNMGIISDDEDADTYVDYTSDYRQRGYDRWDRDLVGE